LVHLLTPAFSGSPLPLAMQALMVFGNLTGPTTAAGYSLMQVG
jgi:hypothetical protein